jgi:phenylacetic acid degradation operon negative regulatory protein
MYRPQSIILTLYGDYVRHRGGEIGVGSLIKLLGNFGLSEQAIRSAVSRMCRSGLLKVRRVDQKSYYSLTEEGRDLVTKGAQRIFQRKNNHWDGAWSIVTYSIPEQRREARDRLRLELGWMGYGALSGATWISPYDLSKEVTALVKKLQVKECVQIFRAEHQGFISPKRIVSQCWDLDRIHNRYASFVAKYRAKLENHLKRLEAGELIEPSECFVERFNLIHEYRRFPFFDPDLPTELLPGSWLRPEAAALFREYHDLLANKANEYFDLVFNEY